MKQPRRWDQLGAIACIGFCGTAVAGLALGISEPLLVQVVFPVIAMAWAWRAVVLERARDINRSTIRLQIAVIEDLRQHRWDQLDEHDRPLPADHVG